jgi:hypothetical protein
MNQGAALMAIVTGTNLGRDKILSPLDAGGTGQAYLAVSKGGRDEA